MRFLILLLFLFSISPSQASVCEKTTEVSVLFSSKEFIDRNVFGFMSTWRWFSPPKGLQKAGHYSIVSVSQIRRTIEFLAASPNCKRIKYLAIFSHGSPGAAYFATNPEGKFENLDLHTVRAVFEGLDYAMATNAKIDFGGCEVGRSCDGEDLMSAIAYFLLPKGGEVKANYYIATTVITGVIPHRSI